MLTKQSPAEVGPSLDSSVILAGLTSVYWSWSCLLESTGKKEAVHQHYPIHTPFFFFNRKLVMWRTGHAALRWTWGLSPRLWSTYTKARSRQQHRRRDSRTGSTHFTLGFCSNVDRGLLRHWWKNGLAATFSLNLDMFVETMLLNDDVFSLEMFFVFFNPNNSYQDYTIAPVFL